MNHHVATLQRFFLFLFIPTLIAVLSSPYPSLNGVPVASAVSAFRWNETSSDGVNGGRQRILLLTAHPDDECMFFAPTLLALLRETHGDAKKNSEVHSLCLSNGDADGLGAIREKELEESLDVLGIMKGHRKIVSDVFYDDMSTYWDAEFIADHVSMYVLEHSIDTILTFDRLGISSHPNHISLLHGISKLLSDPKRLDCASASNTVEKYTNCTSQPNLRAFSLRTVGVIQKYTGPVGAALQLTHLFLCKALVLPSVLCQHRIVFVSSWRDYITALRAMMKHRSQLVWFRWLYVSWSRYMWINDWVEVTA